MSQWDMELQKKYPNLRDRGRKTYTHEDTPQITSVETYFRGELQTYSPRTIDIYLKYVIEKEKGGINLGEMNLANTARHYGYQSLVELNERISAKQ